MVTDPVTCSPEDTLAEVDALCAKFRISGLPVVDEAGRLVGIITNRDMRFEVDHSRRVREVMTSEDLVTAQVGVTAEAALGLLRRRKIEKLPLVDGAGHPARAHHGQGLRQDRAVPDGHQGPRRPPALRRGGRRRRRRLVALDGAGRRRRGRPRRRHRARALARGHRDGREAQAGARRARRGRRRQRRHPRGRPGARRRGRGRHQGRRRAGLDLHHAGHRRGRRPADHRDPRGRGGRRAGRRPGDRRRRAAVLRRHREGARLRARAR